VALAVHRFRAVPASPPELAIDAAVRAARWAQDHVAHRQADEQLRAALDLVSSVPDGQSRVVRELELLDQLGNLSIITTGYAAPGLDEACARMRELCRQIDDGRQLVPALWRLAILSTVRTQLDVAVSLGEQLLALAETAGPAAELTGHMALGASHNHRGEPIRARRHLDAALDLCALGHDAALVGAVAETPGVWARVFSAWNWWLLGEDDRAEEVVAEAVTVARAAGDHTYAMTFALWFAALIATLRKDVDATRRRADEGIAQATAGGYGMFIPFMVVSRGWSIAAAGDVESGTSEMRDAGDAVKSSGAGIMRHVFPGFLADIWLRAGRHEDALAAAADGLAEVERTGERWYEAELHRLRGEALAALDADDPAARAAFERAVEIATAQGAAGLRRRAAESLARRPG
jgi:predicted ATPase